MIMHYVSTKSKDEGRFRFAGALFNCIFLRDTDIMEIHNAVLTAYTNVSTQVMVICERREKSYKY